MAHRRRVSALLILGLIALAGAAIVVAFVVIRSPAAPAPGAALQDPPILAGQPLWGSCSGGFYARLRDAIVLTSSGHCTTEGTVAYDSNGTTVRGVFGPSARDPKCPFEGHRCAASDMNYLVVADDQIPWGHLSMINLGTGGIREILAGTVPLACGDIEEGDAVEINGRNVHRTGSVAEKGEYLHDNDGDYFP